MDFSRRDLAALNIMRGRDNGLPDYNTVRRYFQLPEIKNWTQINPQLFERSPELFEALDDLYGGRLDDVDLYIGGMLETELEGRPGPLFRKIIRQQFERIRDADRFWFENTHNGIFSESEVSEIRSITLWDVLVNTTGIQPDAIQRNVFTWTEGDPCPQPKQLVSADLEPCLMLSGYDYFHGNEVTYIYSCILLAFIPIACAGLGYGVIKLENRRRRMIRMRQEVIIGKHCEKLDVKEWLHNNHKRCVKVKIGPDDSISTLNRKGETLRKVDFQSSSTVVVEVTDDANRKPMVLVRSPRDHDLVLQFRGETSRKKFLSRLESFLSSRKKTLDLLPVYRDSMLANAETKEKRQKRLEHFFREAYALTFGLRPGEKRHLEDVGSSDVIMVMRTSLSKQEFAEALGMRPESLFVKNMFNCVDKDKDGRISFQEFLDTVVLFSRGKTEDKLRIVFDMCDDDGNGVIDKRELMQMLRSLVDIAKTDSLDEVQVMDLIQGMFEASGLQDKEELGYEDFKLMMKEYKGDFIAIGLDCKGAKQNFLDTSTNIARMTSFQISRPAEDPPSCLCGKFNQLATFLEEYRQHIFYLFVFYVVTGVLFLERFVFYSYFAEHTDLRHVMGLGIAVTRGSAAALSFCYSLLLLTMCRNLITKLRELPLHQYVPLDSHVQFHKVVALTALFFSMIHTVGHCINFYHVSTQPVDNLRCLTKEVHFDSDFKPTISYWLFQTVTGPTCSTRIGRNHVLSIEPVLGNSFHISLEENLVPDKCSFYFGKRKLSLGRREVIRSKRPGMLSDGVILLHDNTHTARKTQECLRKFKWEVWSPDSAPNLGSKHLSGTSFYSESDVKTVVENSFNGQDVISAKSTNSVISLKVKSSHKQWSNAQLVDLRDTIDQEKQFDKALNLTVERINIKSNAAFKGYAQETLCTTNTKPCLQETLCTTNTKNCLQETLCTTSTKPCLQETLCTTNTKPCLQETLYTAGTKPFALLNCCPDALLLKSASLWKWQTDWDEDETGRLINNIIPKVSDIPSPCTREVIQFATGHGPFPCFLKRFETKSFRHPITLYQGGYSIRHWSWSLSLLPQKVRNQKFPTSHHPVPGRLFNSPLVMVPFPASSKGVSGILLYAIVCVMFIFAHPRIRQKAYKYFWSTHSLYVLLYFLCLVHGLAKITGTPRFWIFFVGPAIVFTLDKVVSLQTKFVELDILDTELLPSDVTKVKFSRPPNFKYLSGQWVRLGLTALQQNEFHSFTLTSAPHENYLSVHVKAQGPWTWKLRNHFDPNNMQPSMHKVQKVRLEGPYGGGNQDWYKFEVAVMVGGGIGVTPYASILNDLVFGTSTNRYSGVACKKVYFLWICPSHRHFEWFIEVLRDVERKDVTNVLEVHIFITQFFHKFDLRTTMLVSKVGVFSCGPSALTKSISSACETVNNQRKLPYFVHHYENF
ncbi:Dual oxidase [Araneus ventricosus]|uniref:NAD(P)H oxidase (H2O2-forming) n=1 Tax=Araneus ventricosus TaxID=182803 RepID=A0A4Y2L9I9_ARAVE|nr:Dual oxidase [Araneus ventricosus]